MTKRPTPHLNPGRQSNECGESPPRQPRVMPYSMKEHPEHEGAVSLVRSGGVATDWEFRQLCERFPEKVVAGIKDLLRTERGQQIAAMLRKEIGEESGRVEQQDVKLG
jgi:hypothetical protein